MPLFQNKLKFNPVIISIISIIIVTFSYLYGIPFLDLMELKTIDLRFKSRGNIPTTSDVVLAVIDEKSIAKEGKWIWPRSKMAELVNRLSNAGAKVIAFDIGFLEADEKSTVRAIEEIQKKMADLNQLDPSLAKYLEDLKFHTDNDRLLANAIRNSTAKVILGYFFQTDEESAGHIDEKEISMHQNNVQSSEYKAVSYSSESAKNIPLIKTYSPQSNIKIISETSNYSGYFNMFPDEDGVVRWLPAVLKCRESIYAPLSIITAGAFLDSQPSVQLYEYGVGEIKIGNMSIPTDEIGRIIINYRGPGKTFPHIPVTDILKGEADTNLIKDKIVLIGATAVGVYDLRVTPFSNVFPGLEIHANVIDSILGKDLMFYPSWANLFDIFAIIVAGLFLGIIIPRTNVMTGAAALLFLFFGYILMCQFLFSVKGWIFNLIYPLSVMIIVYVSITLYRYIAESKQKKFIRDAFSTYLAPSVVKQLIDSPEKLDLGGQERDISAFFSDVQGFTGISETLSPKELVDLLNEFLTEMTDIILEFEGTVDKFEGDAIIAFFGAPNDLPNHAEVACRASIKMQKRLVTLRTKWKQEKKPGLKMRIGLCSGNAVVGNMGSKNRMDYTMMGDTVNIAARLEGVNKIYGIYSMISDTTFAAAGNGIVTREIDSVNLVGRKEPVTIYELVGHPEDVDDGMRRTFDSYAKGLEAYRKSNWDLAIKQFISALDITINDGPGKTMLARCNEYKLNPPDKDWNGAYTIKTK
ncbi:MAG: adenylate/guanylate cyclase domain-containing protein [Desulfobacteraceae bacterium A6]|nr:MAG: adenylate/guanylate cyclase domain-containing protein [Desulfobacteraceae bacterium A6]